jgi:hypothetical protein
MKIKNSFSFGITDADYQSAKTPAKQISGNVVGQVTFRDFAKLMRKRKRTLNDLTEMLERSTIRESFSREYCHASTSTRIEALWLFPIGQSFSLLPRAALPGNQL